MIAYTWTKPLISINLFESLYLFDRCGLNCCNIEIMTCLSFASSGILSRLVTQISLLRWCRLHFSQFNQGYHQLTIV